MTHVLRITDGTTTVNLAGGSDDISMGRNGYVPRTPDLNVAEAESLALEDGGRVTNITRRNITEPCDVTITADTADEVRAALRSVEGLLRQGEEYVRRGVGAPVYVEIQPGGTGDVYRSPLYYGTVTPGSQALGIHYKAPGMESRITWRRAWYWEGPEVAIPLTNGNGTDVTNGLVVYCHNDGDSGHDNWVAIDGADVDGVIPAPIRLLMENMYVSGDRGWHHYVAHNVWSDPASITYMLEMDDADYKVGDLSAISDSSCSDGYYQPFSWATSAKTTIARFDFSAAVSSYFRGNFFRVLARFKTAPPSGLYLQPQVRYQTTVNPAVVFESAEVLADTGRLLQDLGVVQIPPWLPGETDLAGVSLSLLGRKTGGTSIDWDFTQLSCLDSWRHFYPMTYGLIQGRRLVDDGIKDVVYTDAAGSGTSKTGHYIAQGRPVHLWPGKDQRLYFLIDDHNGGMAIARTCRVTVYYRPRRLTL